MSEYGIKILISLAFLFVVCFISWIDKIVKENRRILRMREEMALNYFILKLTLSEAPDVLDMPVLDKVNKNLRDEINAMLSELDVPSAFITYSDAFMSTSKRLALFEELINTLAKQR